MANISVLPHGIFSTGVEDWFNLSGTEFEKPERRI